jgi:transketolase
MPPAVLKFNPRNPGWDRDRVVLSNGRASMLLGEGFANTVGMALAECALSTARAAADKPSLICARTPIDWAAPNGQGAPSGQGAPNKQGAADIRGEPGVRRDEAWRNGVLAPSVVTPHCDRGIRIHARARVPGDRRVAGSLGNISTRGTI